MANKTDDEKMRVSIKISQWSEAIWTAARALALSAENQTTITVHGGGAAALALRSLEGAQTSTLVMLVLAAGKAPRWAAMVTHRAMIGAVIVSVIEDQRPASTAELVGAAAGAHELTGIGLSANEQALLPELLRREIAARQLSDDSVAEEEPLTATDIAQRMYEAYVEHAGGLNFQGNPCPDWEMLTDAIRSHWEAAAETATEILVG